MTARVLVAYATRKGSTAEIAKTIGDELRVHGYDVTVKEMAAVTSLDGFEAVILGAPIYTGKIIDMGKFAGRHREGLTLRLVAGFTVGLAPVSGDQKQVDAGLATLRSMLDPFHPLAVAFFAGRLDPAGLSFIEKAMIGMVKAPSGDFRDWKAIGAWAREIAEKIGK